MEGCERGLNCSNETYFCGEYLTCSPCTFEECEEHAQDQNSVAFSYTGVGRTHCKMCDEIQLIQKSQSIEPFGIYRDSTKGKVFKLISLEK